MKLNYKIYLILFLIGWVVNSYGGNNKTYYVAPGEVVPYPTGAGSVYIDDPQKPNSGYPAQSEAGRVLTKNQGASKKWSEQSTSTSNASITIRCNTANNWFFAGWTEDKEWTNGSNLISEETSTTINSALQYYNTGISEGNYASGGAVSIINWVNNNLESCKFYYANFTRVKATTNSSQGTVSYSPLVNKDDDVVTLTATPLNADEVPFSHWELNGEQVSTDNTLTFTITSENYGEYKAIFQALSYPSDGTYIFKNVGTDNYASYGGNIHLPNAKRTKDFCRIFFIQINDDGEITTLTSDDDDIYGYRPDLISFANNVLTSLGVQSPDASTFINSATALHVEPSVGGYRVYHQIPDLSSSTSSITNWAEIKEAVITALNESSFSLPEQRYLTKAVNSIEPGGKYYLVASTDGEEILYSTDGTTNYSLWNTEDPTTKYPYFTTNYTWAHLKNIGTGSAASFVGNDFTPSTNVDFSGIVSLKEYSTATSDPGAVLFIRNNATQSDVYSQGYSIRHNNQDWLRINANEDLSVKITPTWYEAATLSTTDGVNIIGNGTYSDWAMEPILSSSMDRYYFGAKCNAKYTDGKGHYYTTMYSYFPYQCMDGVKAYYINASGVDLDNKRITCTEIESGKVPANTAVILECEGLKPIENRLLPLGCSYDWNNDAFSCSDHSVGSITDNILIGVYFNLYNDKHENRTEYNPDRYLTFSISNGLLGFYKHNSLQYLTPAKAYLDMNKLESAGIKSLNGYTLSFGGDKEEATGIIETNHNKAVAPKGVYNMMGVKVGESIDDETLPKGIYIVNGQKYLKR